MKIILILILAILSLSIMADSNSEDQNILYSFLSNESIYVMPPVGEDNWASGFSVKISKVPTGKSEDGHFLIFQKNRSIVLEEWIEFEMINHETQINAYMNYSKEKLVNYLKSITNKEVHTALTKHLNNKFGYSVGYFQIYDVSAEIFANELLVITPYYSDDDLIETIIIYITYMNS